MRCSLLSWFLSPTINNVDGIDEGFKNPCMLFWWQARAAFGSLTCRSANRWRYPSKREQAFIGSVAAFDKAGSRTSASNRSISRASDSSAYEQAARKSGRYDAAVFLIDRNKDLQPTPHS